MANVFGAKLQNHLCKQNKKKKKKKKNGFFAIKIKELFFYIKLFFWDEFVFWVSKNL